MFLSLLGAASHRSGIEAHAYALMGNHFHLLLYCPVPALSDAMHYLLGVYTQRFNRRHGFDGPLFRERFKSVPVTTDEQLLWVSRYIHRNPEDLGPNVDLASYPWSSYGAYIDERVRPHWLRTQFILNMAYDYRRFVESDHQPAPRQDGSTSPKIDQPVAPTCAVGIEAVEHAVARAANIEMADLFTSVRGRPNLARNLAFAIAVETQAQSPHELAARYGLSGATSVWSGITRARAAAETDVKASEMLARARQELSQSR